MQVDRIDHIQIAMPNGGEDQARAFYTGLLGIPEIAKPQHLASRGGCWFERGDLKIHLGVDADFRAARKAHPGLIVSDLETLIQRLSDAGHKIVEDEPREGFDRYYVDDPFGNRIELLGAHS